MKSNQDRGGFALIISLGIMALIILLILAMTSMIRVEIEKSSGDHARSVAKNNALLALKEAIGNLQKYAGPDTRSTASAQLLNESNPKWTGIWPSDENASLGAGITPGEPVWLVSNETDITPNRKLTNPITLKKYNKDGNTYSKVEAGLKKVDSSSETGSGGYAWWVEDESLKASLFPQNAVRSVHETTDSSNSVYQQIQSGNLEMVDTSRRFGVFPGSSPQVLGQDWKDFDYSAFENRDYSILTSLENLPLVKTNKGSGSSVISKDQLSKYLFDFTITNKGVLANAWSGGLRKDLTRGLDDQYEDKLVGNPIFQEIAEDGTPLYGDTWKFFRDFYKTYSASDSYRFNNKTINYQNFSDVRDLSSIFVSRGTNRYRYDTDMGLGSWRPYIKPYPTIDAHPSFYTSNIRPTLLRLRIGIGFSTEAVDITATPIEYRLRLHLYPTVTLWNPFNFPIDLSRCYGGDNTITSSVMNRIFAYINKGLMLSINGRFPDPGSSIKDPPDSTDLLYVDRINIDLPVNGRIGPGEIKVYGLNSTAPLFSENLATVIASPPTKAETASINLVDAGGDPLVTSERNVWQYMPANYTYTAGSITLDNVSRGPRNSSYLRVESNLIVPNGAAARAGMSDGNMRTFYNETARFSDDGVGDQILANEPSDIEDILEPPQIAVYELEPPLIYGNDRLSTFSQLNPLGYESSRFSKQSGTAPAADLFYNHRAFSGTDDPVTGTANTEVDFDAITGNGYFGVSNLSGSGTSQIVLYDVPRHPLTSLAEFMHANSSHFRETATYPVASSVPCVAMNDLSQTFFYGNLGSPAIQHSGIDLPYYMNRALFDDYFLSTIPSSAETSPYVYPYGGVFGNTSTANDYITSGGALSNPRLVYYNRPDIADLRDNSDAFESAAAHLLIDGAFNINSTSVEAWAAVLAGFRGMAIEGASNFTNTDTSPFTRLFIPRSDSTNPYAGYASLNDSDIRALATSIVNEIRERRTKSPYGRLADFINRDPKASTNDNELGLLDEAIKEAPQVNQNIIPGIPSNEFSPVSINKQTNNRGLRTYTDEVQPYHTAFGLPGWLTQQDILRPLAPIMTTRGDTFRIRSYGEYKNSATNEVASKAWIEALVQRVPDYIDNVDSAWVEPSDTTAENQKFGRRFRVVSFRWLHEKDI